MWPSLTVTDPPIPFHHAGVFYCNTQSLVLRARSEIIGSALMNETAVNPKHEIRNPKQYPMTKIQMFQTTHRNTMRRDDGFVFVIKTFGI